MEAMILSESMEMHDEHRRLESIRFNEGDGNDVTVDGVVRRWRQFTKADGTTNNAVDKDDDNDGAGVFADVGINAAMEEPQPSRYQGQ
jgi:hypothetical protein